MSLKFDHLDKFYGDVHALKDASFQIDKKQFIVLAGPSGCGKTTLLNLIAGFLTPDQGQIWLDGQRIDDLQPQQRGIAMVFQDAALFPHRNVFENIAIGLEYGGLTKKECEGRVLEMASIVGVKDLLDRKASTLSNGQKQRVSIARALVRNPRLFLMDEPLSALDARLKSQLRIEIAQLYQRLDATFLYVTHDQIEAMTLADTLIIMKDGRFQQIGSPMEIYQNPSNLFTASFLGKFDINCFKGTIQDNYLCFEERRLPLHGHHEHQDVIIAVRSEHIHQEDGYGERGTIVLAENLGDEIYYHIRWKEQIVIMKGSSNHHIHVNDTIYFSFNFHDAFYFDAANETRIRL